MSKLLSVLSPPYVRNHETTHSTILNAVIAMLPATIFGVYHSGMRTLPVPIVTVVACILSEYAYEKLMKKQNIISNRNILVTGMILALNMPPEIPVWIPAPDGIFAIIVVRQLYNGLGQNFMNLALVARCFPLIFFVGKMINFSYSGSDGVSGVTPLVMLKSGQVVDVPTMFVGSIPGTIGEVPVITLLIGTAYLLAKKVTSIRIPGTYILTIVIFVILFESHGFDLNYITTHLYGDGLIFGAFFIATNYVTSPVTPKGQIVFGILLGVFTGLLRIFGGSTEGAPYVIIISNIFVLLIEKVTLPKAFGKGGK